MLERNWRVRSWGSPGSNVVRPKVDVRRGVGERRPPTDEAVFALHGVDDDRMILRRSVPADIFRIALRSGAHESIDRLCELGHLSRQFSDYCVQPVLTA